MDIRFGFMVSRIGIFLVMTFASRTNLAQDRDDITDILPESVMIYAEVACQQIINGQSTFDLLLPSKQFEGVIWETVYVPIGPGMVFLGFDMSELERFIGQHLIFAAAQKSPAIEIAFVPDDGKDPINVFQAVAAFRLEDRQVYEDFVAKHLAGWEKIPMRHAEIESASHDETGVTFHEFYAPFGEDEDQFVRVPVAYTWWFDGRVWMASHQVLADQLIERCRNPGNFKSLARDNRRFEIVARQGEENQDGSRSRFYIDYLNMFEKHPIWNYGRVVEVDGEKKPILQFDKQKYGKQYVPPYRDNLAMWGEIYSDEDRSHWQGSTKVLYTVPRRDPLSKMKLDLPKDWEIESWLPDSLATYATTQFNPASDPQAVFELSTRMLGMDVFYADAAQKLIDPILRQLSDEQRRELLTQLTGRVTTVATDGYQTKMILLELKDLPKPLSSIEGVAAKWEEEAEQVELGKRKPESGRYSRLKREKYNDSEIYFVEVHSPSESYKNSYVAVLYATPSVAPIDNFLVFSSDRDLLKATLDQHAKDTESEFVLDLRKATAKSPDLAHSDLVIYSKVSSLSRIAHDWLRVPPANKIREVKSDRVPIPRRITGGPTFLDGVNRLTVATIERLFPNSKQHALITVSQTEKTFEIQFSIK